VSIQSVEDDIVASYASDLAALTTAVASVEAVAATLQADRQKFLLGGAPARQGDTLARQLVLRGPSPLPAIRALADRCFVAIQTIRASS
jgi:hypothetical protein